MNDSYIADEAAREKCYTSDEVAQVVRVVQEERSTRMAGYVDDEVEQEKFSSGSACEGFAENHDINGGLELAIECSGAGNDASYIALLRADMLASSMLDYVKCMLAPVDSISKSGLNLPFRSRYSHTERVIERALRINEIEGGDAGIIAVAAIFHDCGYCYAGEGHALHSARIFDEYLAQVLPPLILSDTIFENSTINACTSSDASNVGLLSAIRSAVTSATVLKTIRDIITIHSDKLISDSEISLETKILMDADLLDEEGVMAILFDCFLEASKQSYDYNSAFDRIHARYISGAEITPERFHTKEGLRRCMKAYHQVGAFIGELKDELGR